MPGISGATSTPVLIPASRSFASASSRARGFGLRGSVARHARWSSVGIDSAALNSVTCVQLAHQVEVAQQQRRLGQHRTRVARIPQRLPDPAHQLVAPLDPLVRVGVGAERHVLARPAGRASSALRRSGALTLTTISRSKSRPASKLEVLVRRSRETVRARVSASPVWIDRPAERHLTRLGHAIENRLRVHLVEARVDRLRCVEMTDRDVAVAR